MDDRHASHRAVNDKGGRDDLPDETCGARPHVIGRPRHQVHPKLYHVRPRLCCGVTVAMMYLLASTHTHHITHHTAPHWCPHVIVRHPHPSCSRQRSLLALSVRRTVAPIFKVQPPSAARARGSGADDKPTWQLFTPAWHIQLWSDNFPLLKF